METFYLPQKEEAFLNLNRPLIFFDLETTGIDPMSDRIVEIYAVKFLENGTQEECHFLINPTIPISAGATATHGITNEMVAHEPTFAQLADELALFFNGCDLAGYNIKKYDVPMLLEEFCRCKKYPINFNDVKLVDAMTIYHQKEKRDLSAAVKFYLEKEHSDAHSAKADVQATINILKKQLLVYDDLQPNTSFLHDYTAAGNAIDLHWKFIRDENGKVIFNFGKHKGLEVCTQVDYLKWMFDEGTFAVSTKMVAKKIYMHCKWEVEIRHWLTTNKLLESVELASVLYTTVKYGEGIRPFSTSQQDGKLTITYQTDPPSAYTLVHPDAKDILIHLLDSHLRS